MNIHAAQKAWSRVPFEKKAEILNRFHRIIQEEREKFAKIISEETGKPLWESRGEVDGVSGKVAASISAYLERCPVRKKEVTMGLAETTHRPLGVVAVLGPYNFPAHLPNGQIVPALLAGNAVIFKPSEETPKTGQFLVDQFIKAGIPKELIQLVQGGPEAGEKLVKDPSIQGVFFTGSVNSGKKILKAAAETPEKVIALEMGGNNPLVISDVEDVERAVQIALVSSFITTGQRCSCARRLIVINNPLFIEKFLKAVPQLPIGRFDEKKEPFMGPFAKEHHRELVLKGYQELLRVGGKVLIEPQKKEGGFFLTPGVVDMTGTKGYDDEIFGPLVQLYRVANLEEAIALANNTQYGLTASLISDSKQEWDQFFNCIEAGIINWNTPTTGALAIQPFGGLKRSGNGRPGAYYMGDALSSPISSLISLYPRLPDGILDHLKE